MSSGMTTGGVEALAAAMRRVTYLGQTQRSAEFTRADMYYWGKQYADLVPWEEEGDTPMRERAPSVQLRWSKLAVDRVNAHLFGAGQIPAIMVEALGDEDMSADAGADELTDEQQAALDAANRRLAHLIRHCKLSKHAPETGRLGLLHGTVGLAFHRLESGRIWLEVLTLADALPTFAREDWQQADDLGLDEDDLIRLDEYWREFKTDVQTGEQVELLHRRLWTTDSTIYYVPLDVSTLQDAAQENDWREDPAKSIQHDLGFVPVVWIKNIEVTGDIDGAPLVEDAERQMEDEVNYTLSQTGRGVRYNQEPLPVFKDVDNIDVTGPDFRRGAGRSLILRSAQGASPTGQADVSLLEMTGSGITSAVAYLDVIKKAYFEILSVVLHDPERWAGASSGVALERLMMPMIALVGRLRTSYGAGLARLAEMMLRAEGVEGARCAVHWPAIVERTATDQQAIIFAVRDLYAAKLVTLETAVQLLSPFTSIKDPASYVKKLAEESSAASGAGGTAGAFDPFAGGF